MSYLVAILTAGSALAGVAVAGWQVLFLARQSTVVKEEVRMLAQDSERRALQSDDLNELGSYLYNNVGPTKIINYVGNEEVRERVSRALDGVLSFLGTEDTEISDEESELVAREANEPDVVSAVEESQLDTSSPTSEMSKAIEEITFGEVWNGLARMRRHIEIRLRELDPELAERSKQTIGRMLAALARSERITDRTEKQLRYALNVANAGIHGNEVSVGQAQEAWEAAVRGLALLPATTA